MPTRIAGKRGKNPVNWHRPRIMARDFIDVPSLPTPPVPFDNAAALRGQLPMALNDRLGDCTIAGFVHIIQILFNVIGQDFAYPGDDAVQSVYFGLTGGQDTGLRLEQVLNAALTQPSGLFGVKLFGFMEIDVHDVELLTKATYAFGSTYNGYEMPQDADEQFEEGEPFHLMLGLNPGVGGHCMVQSGIDAEGPAIVTWGGETSATWNWMKFYASQAYVLIPQLWVDDNHTPLQNVDLEQLEAAMKTIGTQS